ncbi:MAG: hypothetical protein ABSH50_28855 [Bryobacteraceae bacterium]|jgi:sulfite reductase beta subunit-like hemoprotein
MDNVRNINGCPLVGLTPDELLDASPVVFELNRLIVGANGNPEFANLPRKFNLTVTGCTANCTSRRIPGRGPRARPPRRTPGFNILAGGKMGSGGFTIAQPLDASSHRRRPPKSSPNSSASSAITDRARPVPTAASRT